MAINLISKYVPLLDEKYQLESKTSILDASPEQVRATENARTFLIPKMTLQGLGDYSRTGGFVSGTVDLEWVSHTLSQDRGRQFTVDEMDNEETANLAFGRLAGEFIRLHVAPELDVYRLSAYYASAGKVQKDGATIADPVSCVDTALAYLDDKEVPEESRIIFITPDFLAAMKADTTVAKRFDVQTQKAVIDRRIELFDGVPLIKVPTGRMKSLYEFYDGSTAGQEDGGFVADGDAVQMNFMVIHTGAVLQITKLAEPRVFDPRTNQSARAWMYDFRIYHDAFVPDNKTDGIYVSTREAAA